jgi:nitrite reductase/ring-hydroxylating ferredoxin subunit
MAGELRPVLRSNELPAASGREAEPGAVPRRPQSRQVDVDGTPLLLLRLASGEAVAIASACPHQGTPLGRSGMLAGEQLRCEQHGFVYDVRSGCNVIPTLEVSAEARYRLKPGHLAIYDVVERDGWLWVRATPRPAPAEDTPPPAPAPAFVGGSPTAAKPPDESAGPPEPASPQALDAGVGEELELTLPTRALPAHLWHVEIEGDAVEILAQQFEQDDEGLRYRVRVAARTPGTAEIRCVYAKPWGKPAQVRTFTVAVSA